MTERWVERAIFVALLGFVIGWGTKLSADVTAVKVDLATTKAAFTGQIELVNERLNTANRSLNEILAQRREEGRSMRRGSN